MKTLLSWSTGKDSAWALHLLRQDPDIEIAGLFTTVNEQFGRVAMHAVRRAVLEAQAAAAGLPLQVIEIPWPCPNEAYEARMGAFVERVAENVSHGAEIACPIRADRPLVAGVSTWGAWGLTAALVALGAAPESAIPTPDDARAQLDALLTAGAVDGVSKKVEPCIDGLPWSDHSDVLEKLRAAVRDD